MRMHHRLACGLPSIEPHIPGADGWVLCCQLLLSLLEQLGNSVPFRLVELQPIGDVTPGDHQAVALRDGIGVGNANRQLVLQQHPAAALQFAEHTALLAMAIAGLQATEVCVVGVALAGVAAETERLQVADVV